MTYTDEDKFHIIYRLEAYNRAVDEVAILKSRLAAAKERQKMAYYHLRSEMHTDEEKEEPDGEDKA